MADIADALTVTGGGSVAVATDELFVHATLFGAIAARAEWWEEQLDEILVHDPSPMSAVLSGSSPTELFIAARDVASLRRETDRLRADLIAAAEEYGRAERGVEALWTFAGHAAGWIIGRNAQLIVLLALAAALPAVIGSTAGVLIGSALTHRSPEEALGALVHQLAADVTLRSDPNVVRLVRVLAASVDDAVAGFIGVPAPVAAFLGDTGAGLIGAPESAAAAVALAAAAGVVLGNPTGPLRETGVRVVPASSARRDGVESGSSGDRGGGSQAGSSIAVKKPVSPPRSLETLVAGIPRPADDGAQYRVDRFEVEGRQHWVLYISGTIDSALTPSTQPLDMTSNIHAVAGGSAASERAALEALRLAGKAPGEPVLVLGHSQGGLVAARLAADPSGDVTAYVNVGGPVGGVPVPDHVPGLSLEHDDDLIPALGGPARGDSDGADGPGRLTVGRRALSGNESSGLLPAHELTRYRETAALVDASDEQRLRTFIGTIRAFTGEEAGESSRWRGERVSPASPVER